MMSSMFVEDLHVSVLWDINGELADFQYHVSYPIKVVDIVVSLLFL